MASGGTVTIRVILESAGFTTGASKVKSDLESIKTEGKDAFTGVSQGSRKATEDVDSLGDSTGRIPPKAREADNALTQTGQKVQKWGAQHKQAGETISKVGGVLTKTLTPAVIGIGAASVASAVSIDTSLTNVRKTVDGTEADYQRLKQAAIDFSKTNAVSASQILDIQALGAQLGFSIDELQEFGEVVSGLDIATNMNADEAATQLAQFANITGLSHDKVRNYASAIVDLGNNFATTEADISNMAMRIAGTGTTIGLTVPQILGMATALSSVGIEAEAGGTAISTIMTTIDQDVARGGEAMQLWADTASMSAEQFAEAWRTRPAEAFEAVLLGMADTSKESGALNTKLEELGITAIRQSDALKRLAQNPELLARAMDTANTAFEENIALNKEVENRNNSLAAKFEMLKNRAIAVGEQIGGPLANALLDVLDAAQPLFEAIENGAKSFSNMSKEEQQSILLTLAFAAALGPLLKVIGSVVKGAEGFGKGMQFIGKGVDKAKGLIQGAGGVVQKFGGWLSGLGKEGTKTNTVMGKLGTGVQNLGTKMSGAEKPTSKLLTLIKGAPGAFAMAGASIVACVACATAAANEFQKLYKYEKDTQTASNGVRDAFAALNQEVETAPSKLDPLSTSLSNAKDALYKAAESQAKFYDGLKTSFEEVGKSNAQLDDYYKTIDELYGRTDLNASEQARLAEALKKVGEATGASIEMTRNQAGAYVAEKDGAEATKDAILNLIEAKKLEAQYDAISSNMASLYDAQTDAIRAKNEAQDAYNRAYEKYLEYQALADANPGNEDLAKQAGQAAEEWAKAGEYLDEATGKLDDANSAIDVWSEHLALLNQATEKGSESIQAAVASNNELSVSMLDAGKSTLDFATQLQDAGVSAEDFKRVASEAPQELASAFDGSFASIAGVLQNHGVQLSEAALAEVDAFNQMKSHAESGGQGIQDALNNAHVTMPEFIQAMIDGGMSVDTFAKIPVDKLPGLISAYQNANGNVRAAIEDFIKANEEAGEAPQKIQEGADQAAENVPASLGRMAQESSARLGRDFNMDGMVAVIEEGTGAITLASEEAVFNGTQPFSQYGPMAGDNIRGGKWAVDQATTDLTIGMPETLNGVLPLVTSSGMMVGPNYGAGITTGSGAVYGAANGLGMNAVWGFDPITGQYAVIGNNAANAAVAAIAAGQGPASVAGGSVKTGAAGGLQPFIATAGNYGTDGVNNFNRGIRSGVPGASSASASVASATSSMKPSGTHGWGYDAVSAFASGIRGAIDLVTSAASAVAGAVASFLHFTHPDVGPLKTGTEIYGKHAAQDFAKGMESEKDRINLVTSAIATLTKRNFEKATANAAIVVNEGVQYLKGKPATGSLYRLMIGEEKPEQTASKRINWYATKGIYNTTEMFTRQPQIGFGGSRETITNNTESPVNVNVHIDHFENSTGQSIDELTDQVTRRIQRQRNSAARARGRR